MQQQRFRFASDRDSLLLADVTDIAATVLHVLCSMLASVVVKCNDMPGRGQASETTRQITCERIWGCALN